MTSNKLINKKHKENMFKSRIIEFVLNPKRVVFFLFSSIIFTAFILVNASRMQVHAAPGINQTINFQGKVVNSNGTNVTDGEYTFVFRIYNVSTGGTHLWTEPRVDPLVVLVRVVSVLPLATSK